MRYLKHRRLHVNMGNYEHLEISATVEVDTVADREALAELEIRADEPDEVLAFIDARLGDLLATDADDAALYTDVDDSFIYPYIEDRNPTKKRRK